MKTRIVSLMVILVVSFCSFSCSCNPFGDDDDLDFEIVDVYGGSGSNPGLFSSPTGLVIRHTSQPKRHTITVADHLNNRVQVFRTGLPEWLPDSIAICNQGPDGENDTIWPAFVTATQSDPHNPSLALAAMRIYVTDSRNNRVLKYDSDGNFLLSWGTTGSDTGQFLTPLGIDMDFEDNIFVVDSGNCRVQVFDTLGNFIRTFGGTGTGSGQFNGPIDIAVGYHFNSESFKYVVVTDNGNNRVQLFDRNGNFLKAVSGIPSPLGLCTNYGLVSVVNGSSRIYQVDGTNPAKARLLRVDKMPESVHAYDLDTPFELAVSDPVANVVYWLIETATQ